MSDNYAVINDKRIKLTDEQVKALGIERKNPFERVNRDVDDKYYYDMIREMTVPGAKRIPATQKPGISNF